MPSPDPVPDADGPFAAFAAPKKSPVEEYRERAAQERQGSAARWSFVGLALAGTVFGAVAGVGSGVGVEPLRVPLALGTDSRASNPDLSLFDELRFAARQHPEVPPAKLLEMATLGGARALGRGDVAGSLAPGNPADLAVVELGSRHADDPHRLLFAASSRVTQTWIAGRRIA